MTQAADDDPTDDPAGRERPVPPAVWTALVLIAVAWVVVLPVVLTRSISDLFGLLDFEIWPDGQPDPVPVQPTPEQLRTLRSTAVAAGIPAVGFLLAVRWRRGAPTAVFGGGVVLALVLGACLYGLVSPDVPEAPVRDDGPRVCQEHSGGDNRCPGG